MYRSKGHRESRKCLRGDKNKKQEVKEQNPGVRCSHCGRDDFGQDGMALRCVSGFPDLKQDCDIYFPITMKWHIWLGRRFCKHFLWDSIVVLLLSKINYPTIHM